MEKTKSAGSDAARSPARARPPKSTAASRLPLRLSGRSADDAPPACRSKDASHLVGNLALQRMLRSGAIQPKYRLNRPGDAYEQEADRAADQVMNAPEHGFPAVSGRAGRTHPAILHRMCMECEEEMHKKPEEEGTLQAKTESGRASDGGTRKESGRLPEGSTARSSFRVPRGGGHSLPASLRAYFETRFGQDFGRVRLHTDAGASESARSIQALAYTSGQDIVFARGQYAPNAPEGKRLLAHELAHVVQQRGGAPPEVRRQTGAGRSTSTTTFEAPANVCSPSQTREVSPAVAAAQRWLHTADRRLTAFSTSHRTPEGQSTALGLLRHFAASDADTARYVQNRIREIADRLRTDPAAPSPLTVECHGTADTNCGAAGAYVLQSMLVFCPSFFGADATWQVMAMIHEIAHSLPAATGSLHITDRAYRSDRLYGSLTPGEALTNAESYAMFVREMALGRVGGTAARDTFEDCPTDWRGALSIAVARAQRWNRDAQVVLRDRRPQALAAWSGFATTHIGGQSSAQLAAAQAVYDRAETRLRRQVDFECEEEGGGRCETSTSYWYALGDFHVCPSWRALPTEEDRAESLLSGLYGYFRIVDDNTRRVGLARLARALHFMYWAPPSAADVQAGLTAARTQPRPPAAPPPGSAQSF